MTSTVLLIGMTLALVALILARVEIAFTLGLISLSWLVIAGEPMIILPSRTFGGLNEFVLLAIPFFLLAGELMNHANITERLIRIANVTLGRVRGGLAQANVGSSLLFAGISGAAVADVVALGSIFVPSMEEEGYDRSFSAAITASSSIIGPIIPPSIILVVYGAVTNTSVGGLFAAAVVPGILLAVSLMGMVMILSRTRDLPRHEPDFERSETPKLAFDSVTALTMPAIILFGIVLGWFTPTEAAAIACAYAILLGMFGYRTLSLGGIHESLRLSIERTAQLYAIIGFATILSWLLAREGVPALIAGFLQDLGLGPIGFMLALSLILLFVGTWLELTAATIILAPTLADLAGLIGIHPLHFGIVMVICLCFGLITPPLGICLFAASSVSKTEVWSIAKQVVPFFVADLFVLVLLIVYPEITLWLPEYYGFIG